MTAAAGMDPGFGVYIHWPFCAQKCPYCDFNSHVRHGGWDEDRFLAAYRREIEHLASLTGPRTVGSIFIGGGTPSLMKPDTVGALIDHVSRAWHLAPGAEITIEANPGSVEAARLAGYRAAGVNRVSIGVQSLREEQLRRLGRIHSVAEAKAALSIARRTFERVSFDLIYARPGQTEQEWRAELAEALELALGHISLYQLTIEPDTPFAALHARGKLKVPEPDVALALYEITQELTAAAGLPAYEISNHARTGEESRHNLLYWRYGEYAGIGPGAHGRLLVEGARHATVTELIPESWAWSVEELGHGLKELVRLSRDEEADEMLLMGLRLEEGLDLSRLRQLFRVQPSATMVRSLSDLGLLEEMAITETPSDRDAIGGCISPASGGGEWSDLAAALPAGAGTRAGRRIRATPRGRFVLNELVLQLSKSFAAVAGT